MQSIMEIIVISVDGGRTTVYIHVRSANAGEATLLLSCHRKKIMTLHDGERCTGIVGKLPSNKRKIYTRIY